MAQTYENINKKKWQDHWKNVQETLFPQNLEAHYTIIYSHQWITACCIYGQTQQQEI